MKQEKSPTISNLFEGVFIRSVWNQEKEEYYFSVVDVIAALTGTKDPSHYWRTLKYRMVQEGNETVTNCDGFKLKSKDGKFRTTDMLNMTNTLRLIESIPSPKAEPFKMWLATVGKERVDEVYDPEKAIQRAITYYRANGCEEEWIETRIQSILSRNRLTKVWKQGGISENYEYGILTNEIYQAWSGMTASQYKTRKGLQKESLRDNMTDVEVVLTDLGEIATKELANVYHPYGMEENRSIAKMGGGVSKVARDDLEQKLGQSVISTQKEGNR